MGKGYGAKSITKEVYLLKSLLKNTPQLGIDIGGNIGEYSQKMIDVYPNLEIHVFEPSAINQTKLKERFNSYPNVIINNYALSDTTGAAELFSDVKGSGLASLTKRNLEHFNIDFNTHETVNVIRFEDYWKSELQSRDIDIAKIDVEGHELYVLKGFGNAINKTKVIQFEFGGGNIDTRTYFQDFWYFFKEHSFKIYRITPFGLEHIWRYTESHETFLTTNFLCVKETEIR